MSDIDLTEAVDAAFDETVLERTVVAYSGDEHTEYFEALFRNALTAALPHIERQVAAKALREAADHLDKVEQTRDEGIPADIRRDPALWLHDRADRVARGAK